MAKTAAMATAHWDVVSPGMLGAAVSGPDGSKRFVVVERLPSGAGWDWLAWQATPERRCLHGLAGSRAAAMRAAEIAVQQLAGPVACPAG